MTLGKSFIIVFHRFLPKEFAAFQIFGISLRSEEFWPATAVTLVHYRKIFVRRDRKLIFWLQVAQHKSILHAKYLLWVLDGSRDMELQSLGFSKMGVFTLYLPNGWSYRPHLKASNYLPGMPDIAPFHGGVHICN